MIVFKLMIIFIRFLIIYLMKNKRCLSIDFFENKMKKIHKHKKKFTDIDIHHTDLTSLLQTTSFNGMSTTDRSNKSHLSHNNDKDYYLTSVKNFLTKKVKYKLKNKTVEKSFLPSDDYLHFEYFTFVPRNNNKKQQHLPKITLKTEPNHRFISYKMDSLAKVNDSIMKNIRGVFSMSNNRSITTTTKVLEVRKEITVPNSPRNEKKIEIKTKTKKNEFDCINPRICFPSVISDIKYMSDIYTQNLNYQKAFLREKYKLKKSMG